MTVLYGLRHAADAAFDTGTRFAGAGTGVLAETGTLAEAYAVDAAAELGGFTAAAVIGGG